MHRALGVKDRLARYDRYENENERETVHDEDLKSKIMLG